MLACGGFEANAEMRTRYLGPGWDLAKVRGTRFNTGGGIKMALEIGAMSYGNWSGCHAVGWDYNAPEFGDLAVGDNFQKHSYPFAIMVNADGVRFCDEGADFRNYTYAKYGREILNQPHQFAWQIFDQQVVHLQRDEYRIRQVTKVTANTIEELADKMAEYAPVDKPAFLKTIAEYNAAVQREHPLQPDGQGRAHHQGARDRQDQLGDAAGKAALRGVSARPAASPSPLAGCASTPTDGCSTPRRRRSPGFTRPASWSAGCSTTTTRAARASCRARCSARSPAPAPASRSGGTPDTLTLPTPSARVPFPLPHAGEGGERSEPGEGSMKPTNVLFILSDEHSRRVLGCYGHKMIRTPNLDALAARGVRFADAYTNSPICVPARATLATGRYPHQIRFWDNGIAYDGSVPSWHHRLREAGHEVASIGKLHFRSEADDNGFSRRDHAAAHH